MTPETSQALVLCASAAAGQLAVHLANSRQIRRTLRRHARHLRALDARQKGGDAQVRDATAKVEALDKRVTMLDGKVVRSWQHMRGALLVVARALSPKQGT
uniref:Uncharacterized protein n=1 Tax=Myxococcus fulvus TaxID=33 RepID=B0YR18_MYXFU|nr:hypothetical protein pMF1.9 [Myxococcus fulvus]